ncbi:Mitochondrial beta-keto-acyl synthase [Ascosphaera aggregata]|nr:Mitochondrial beta-keto-acyl synthase [Ascosphaera aggregata]
MALRRVVVTGLGAVTPLGVGVGRSWSRLLAGDCGVVSLRDRDPRFRELPSQIGATVPEGNREDGGWNANDWLSKDEERKIARFAQYAIAASEEALSDARWRPDSPADKEMTGICLGSGIGNFDEIYHSTLEFEAKVQDTSLSAMASQAQIMQSLQLALQAPIRLATPAASSHAAMPTS